MCDSVPIWSGPRWPAPVGAQLRAHPGIAPEPVVVRAPVPFRDRVIGVFCSGRNVAYLSGRVRCDAGSVAVWASSNAHEILRDDPLARRGSSGRATDLWEEVRRLNRAFLAASRGADLGGREPYHIRAFIDESLCPPGLEHLNDPDRPMFGGTAGVGGPAVGADVEPVPHYAEEDWAWDSGNATRTAEQAMAEYWGEENVATQLGPSPRGPSYAEQALRGEWWFTSDGNPRRQRYVGIPRWQIAGGRNQEADIAENLGGGSRETGNEVRGWDMSRFREGSIRDDYHNYGPRSGGGH